MFGPFKKGLLADWLGETLADIVFKTNTEAKSEGPDCDASRDVIFSELVYLDTFLVEQAVTALFPGTEIGAKINKAYLSRLVQHNLQKTDGTFSRAYDERRSAYLSGWSLPLTEPVLTHLAGQACMRCASLQYTLLMFFITHISASYQGALNVLDTRDGNYKIV